MDDDTGAIDLHNISSTYLAIGGIGVSSVLIYITSMIITFPLYVYVHRVNEKTDKLAYFYPITNHFYTVICSMQLYMYATIFTSFLTWTLFGNRAALSVILISFSIGYLLGVAVTSVQNVLLFVLALRRFLIFFVSNFKKIISINPKIFGVVLKLLYAFYFILQIGNKIVKILCGSNSMFKAGLLRLGNRTVGEDAEELNETVLRIKSEQVRDSYVSCTEGIDSVYMKVYLAGDILVLLATVLYVIMFIKIRRWSRMTGDQLNHPEKYIFYQTILIVLTKLLAIIMVVLYILEGSYTIESAFGFFVVIDITTTPMVIQCSYLLCNRANIDAVLAIQFRKLRTWLVLLCGEEPRRRPRRRRNAAARYKAAKQKVQNLISMVSQLRQNDVAVEPTVIVIKPETTNRRRNTMPLPITIQPGDTPRLSRRTSERSP